MADAGNALAASRPIETQSAISALELAWMAAKTCAMVIVVKKPIVTSSTFELGVSTPPKQHVRWAPGAASSRRLQKTTRGQGGWVSGVGAEAVRTHGSGGGAPHGGLVVPRGRRGRLCGLGLPQRFFSSSRTRLLANRSWLRSALVLAQRRRALVRSIRCVLSGAGAGRRLALGGLGCFLPSAERQTSRSRECRVCGSASAMPDRCVRLLSHFLIGERAGRSPRSNCAEAC